MTDNALTQRWQNGDTSAFDELYTCYAPMIYRLGWAMLQEAQSAEDVVQETFLRAHNARQRFDPQRAGFSTWLYQIALNYCRSYLRRKRLLTVPWSAQTMGSVDRQEPAAGPEDHFLRSEYQRTLWEAVQLLSPRLREVITLYYYLDLSAVDIATTLNCPEGTVYSRLHNARRRLATSLKRRGISAAEMSEVGHVSS